MNYRQHPTNAHTHTQHTHTNSHTTAETHTDTIDRHFSSRMSSKVAVVCCQVILGKSSVGARSLRAVRSTSVRSFASGLKYAREEITTQDLISPHVNNRARVSV
jgi:hypothetical protein